METWDRLTAAREEKRGWKEGEEISQRTCMNDPRTWTMVWGLTVGAEGEMGGGRQRGKSWDNCNRITVKIIHNVVLNY